MSVSFSQPAITTEPGTQFSLATLLSLTSGDQPQYIVLTGLDRERYTVASNGDRGAVTGNGHTLGFTSYGSDCYNFGILFEATGNGYYNSTYGYLSDLKFRSSTDNNRTECLSLYGFGTAGTANAALSSKLANTLSDPYFDGLAFTHAAIGGTNSLAYLTSNYLGTLDIVTRAGYVDSTPNAATPDEIAAVAATFVGEAWNQDGCWNLACNIAALAGASLPLTSTKALVAENPPVANGEWIVAYNSATVSSEQQKNWISLLRPGDVVVVNNTCGGHVATVVSGLGYSSKIVDNYGPSAGDGSPVDVRIGSAHDLLNLIIPADSKNIAIYRLDAPVITVNKALCLGANGTASITSLFSTEDPAGQPIASYQFYDTNTGAAGGSFVVNGTTRSAHDAGAAITVDALDLAATGFVAGSLSGTDTIRVRAYNGHYWGDWESISVAVGSPVQPPVARALANEVKVHGGQSIALSSLLTIAAPDSPVVSYTISDPGSGGHVQLNGASPLPGSQSSASGSVYEVSAADFAKLTYVGGANIGGEMLTITAHNGAALAGNSVSLSMATIAPSVVGISHYVAPGAQIPVSSLFSVSQLDTAPLVSYMLNTRVSVISWGANVPSSGGSLQLNGVVPMATYATGDIQIAAADLPKVTFQAAPDSGAQFLQFWASDGANGVGGTAMVTTVAQTAPVTAVSVSVGAGRPVPVSSLFSLAAGASTPAYYRFLDPAGGGSLQLDPSATNLQSKSDPSPGVFVVRAADLDKLVYAGGNANGTESLAISTSDDNFHWSAEVPLPVSTIGVVTGGTGNDTFAGMLKDFFFDGDQGIDTVAYSGKAAEFSLTRSSDGTYSIQDIGGAGGADCLKAIDRLQFADRTVALDIDGNAGQAYRLYQAAFSRRPDNDGLKYWIGQIDKGVSLGAAASAFIGSSEFQSLYGADPSIGQLITLLYNNVLHRAPDQGGYEYWISRFNAGAVGKDSLLVNFSESAENQAAVIGAIQNGIELF